MLVATSDEILWKGLKLGGFEGHRGRQPAESEMEDTFEASRNANSLPIAKKAAKKNNN
jgi:hypothetical protein